MLTIAFFSFSLVAYICFRAVYSLFFHPLSSVPGPLLAKFTNIWRATSYFAGSQQLVDYQLHQKYGDLVRDGPDSLLCCDPEAFKAIYNFQGTVRKGPFYSCMNARNSGIEQAFGASSNEHHKNERKRLNLSAFGPVHVERYEPIMNRKVDAFIKKLSAERASKSHSKFDIAPYVERLTFDINMEIAFGSSFDSVESGMDPQGMLAHKKVRNCLNETHEEKTRLKTLQKIIRSVFGVGMIPWLATFMAWAPVENWIRKAEFDKQGRPLGLAAFFSLIMQQWSHKIMDDAFDGGVSQLPPCVLRNCLEVNKQDSKRLPDQAIRNELDNVYFAGPGSTAAGVNAVIYELARHVSWQNRVFKEVKHLSADDRTQSKNLVKLPALQAVIKEALRLHPPFSGPLERVIAKGGENIIPGVKALPLGTRVWSSNYVMSRSKKIFGEDAESFKPDRWIQSSPEELKRFEDGYSVFGRGSRNCVGKEIAWKLLEKMTVSTVQSFEIRCEERALNGFNAAEMQYELEVTLKARA